MPQFDISNVADSVNVSQVSEVEKKICRKNSVQID